MTVVLVYTLGCLVLALRGAPEQVVIWLTLPPVLLAVYRLARWADRLGWWHPGDGRAKPRWWGQRW